MANIKKHLDNIKGALYGKDVRSSIHDGIDAINKEVESTTGRQVDLEKTFDQLVINAGNSNAEIVDARVKSDGTSYSKLGDRLNEVDSQLEQNMNQLSLSSGSSDGIVHFNYDEVDDYFQGMGIIESNSDYEEIINLFDSYIIQNSDYISKENLGKDSSGKNDIYSYILTPKCYTNTVIIIAGVHGDEKCSAYSCLELIKQLTNSNRNNMQYLRHNTQFVILPIANPWGYINHTRGNYNGVDINRNFDYKFTASAQSGSNAFSEKETQYIRDLLYRYKENCDLVIDLHHYATPTPTTLNQASGHQYITWTTRWSNNYFEDFRNILKTLSDSYDITTGGIVSSIDNYVNTKLKIPAVTCEIDMGLLSQYCYGKTSIIHQLNMLVNYSLVTTRKNKFTLETDGFVTRLLYGTEPRNTNKFTVVNNTTGKAVYTPFTYSFDIPTSGYVEVDGLVEVELLDSSTRVSLIPCIGQVGGDQLGSEYWYNNIYESYNYNPFTRYSTNETIVQTIPIKALTRVVPTNTSTGKCDFSLMVWQYNPSNVDMYIRKFHIFLKYTPSNVGLSVKSITFDNDNNPKQTYPDKEYFV